MRRVRQEASEHYEVTATEIALAFGLLVEEGDEVSLNCRYGDKFQLIVRSAEIEDVEIEVPPVVDVLGPAYEAAYLAGLEASRLLSYAPFGPFAFQGLPPAPLDPSPEEATG